MTEPTTAAGRALLALSAYDGLAMVASDVLLDRILAIEAEARQQDDSALRIADEAASVAHDYIWPQEKKPGVTSEEASDAIWTIHNTLRPLIEHAALPPSAPPVLDVERLLEAERNTAGPAFPMSEFLPRLAAEYARLQEQDR